MAFHFGSFGKLFLRLSDQGYSNVWFHHVPTVLLFILLVIILVGSWTECASNHKLHFNSLVLLFLGFVWHNWSVLVCYSEHVCNWNKYFIWLFDMALCGHEGHKFWHTRCLLLLKCDTVGKVHLETRCGNAAFTSTNTI